MPAITGEPLRGVAAIDVRDSLDARLFAVAVSFDGFQYAASGTENPGDQTTWEGAPGASLTLRYRYRANGDQSTIAPDAATVELRVPGGAIVGAAWSPAATSADATRTFHFDSDPLSQVLDALRAGALEIYVTIRRNAAVAWGPSDSRGAQNLPASASAANSRWARGYCRAMQRIASHSISNVAIGGAEPATFVRPDALHTRVVYAAAWYEAVATELELLRANLATVEREQTLAGQTAVNHDFSWTGTTGTNRRVGNGMQLAAELKDLCVKLPAADFGGDNKFVFDTVGHEAGWTRNSDLVMLREDRITVDPRVDVAHLLQPDEDDFATPPLSLNTGQMLSTQLGFLSARFRNARGEGQNDITATLKNWDVNEFTGTEAAPTNTTTQDTGTQGGEAGWLDTATGKLPLVWDEAKPGGTWRVKAIITAPADAVGLEQNATRDITLLAPDPRIQVVAGAGVTAAVNDGDHWHPGEPLLVGLALVRVTSGGNVVLTPDASPAPSVFLGRFNVTLARAEYLDSDLIWKPTAAVADMYGWPLSVSPGDPKVFIRTFSGAQTADWGHPTLHGIASAHFGGTPYSGAFALDTVADSYKHDAAPFALRYGPLVPTK